MVWMSNEVRFARGWGWNTVVNKDVILLPFSIGYLYPSGSTVIEVCDGVFSRVLVVSLLTDRQDYPDVFLNECFGACRA